MTAVAFTLDVATPNVLNGSHQHWGIVAARRKSQRHLAMVSTRAHVRHWDGAPLVVTLMRLSAGTLDDDAIAPSCKSIRDGIADALGLDDDADPRITWRYAQERCKRGLRGVAVHIEPRDEP